LLNLLLKIILLFINLEKPNKKPFMFIVYNFPVYNINFVKEDQRVLQMIEVIKGRI
jgi:hypothetical protein